MSLVPAKCTQCGANLDVDSSQEAAVCPHCKTPFITEKAINNYNTTNVTNIDTINAEVVNVESSDSVENLVRNAETLVKFGEWPKANEIYTKITELYPQDWRGWYGLLLISSHNFSLNVVTVYHYESLVKMYQKLLCTADNTCEFLPAVKKYFELVHINTRNALEKSLRCQQQVIQDKITQATAMINKDIPTEVQDTNMFGLKAMKFIWISWVVVAFIATLVQTIIINSNGHLDIQFAFVSFRFMNMFWDISLFVSVLALIIQLVVSLCLCLLGCSNIFIQKNHPQKLLTPLKFFTRGSIITVSIHLLYGLIATMAVSFDDPGFFFFKYGGIYRHIETILFDAKATETNACWIAVLLILIHSLINFALVAVPLFITERIGNKKRKAILINVQHKQEIDSLVEESEAEQRKFEESIFKIDTLNNKCVNS